MIPVKNAAQKIAKSVSIMSGKLIKTIAVNEGMSLTELSGKLGISRQALYKRLNGDMRMSSFEECLKAMGYELYYGKDGKVRKI